MLRPAPCSTVVFPRKAPASRASQSTGWLLASLIQLRCALRSRQGSEEGRFVPLHSRQSSQSRLSSRQSRSVQAMPKLVSIILAPINTPFKQILRNARPPSNCYREQQDLDFER